MRTGLAWGAVLACALGAAVTARPARAADPKPESKRNLSGTWQLNEKESDNPRDKLRGGTRRPMGGGGFGRGMGGRGGGMGGGGRGGFGGGGPGMGGGGGEGRGGPGGFERMQARFRTLVIRHDDPVLRVEYGDESDDTFYTDARKVKRDDERGTVEVQTKWKDGRVLVERNGGRGKSTETLELSPDGKRLTVVTKAEGGPMGSVEIRRVYDAQAAAVPTS